MILPLQNVDLVLLSRDISGLGFLYDKKGILFAIYVRLEYGITYRITGELRGFNLRLRMVSCIGKFVVLKTWRS